jgi:crotonobetainyl-CoA:carnitine CoA-transferase CaiB-like acyl-CoA transferase
MGAVPVLGELLGCPALLEFAEKKTWFTRRDEIKGILRDHLKNQTTSHWLGILEPADIWCAEILSWQKLRQTEGYLALDMEQTIQCPMGTPMPTLRCPIRIDGEIYKSTKGAPSIGQHTTNITEEFQLP